MGTLFGMIKKDVAFKIRIEGDLRKEFIETCRSNDMSAAQVVRKFMRDYIAQYRDGLKHGTTRNIDTLK